ncbi:hypothetical protein TNCV_4538231 [Trichonephila clavipes]|uniref:Uncharacterized protein n=1 Tax=Trichonephila clavipes TaxID=2585209 RepID=A0A8X7BJG4_TRICX|nr:hypothetical protein TNCV_4538231 [Trichonephila clavipes]
MWSSVHPFSIMLPRQELQDHRNGVFLDVTGIKPCPDLSPNQNTLRIASGTESTLIRKGTRLHLSVVRFCALCTTVNGGVGGRLSMGGSVQDGWRIGPCESVWPQ